MQILTQLQVRILSALSEEVAVEDGHDAPIEDPLKVLEWSYPNLRKMISGKSVLDLGCGFGDQAAAMKRKYGCTVTGVDTDEKYIQEAMRRYGDECEFLTSLPSGRQWDVVISINAMEHYPDPQAVLWSMLVAAKRGGRVLITFGPLWWAPYGSHMQYFCRLPWLQLWFSERAIMAVRAKYRDDGAKRFEECRGGLNRMSVRRFKKLVRHAAGRFSYDTRLTCVAVKRLQFLTHVPLLRELFTNHVICEMTARN